MSLQRFLYKMKLSKQFVIRLSFSFCSFEIWEKTRARSGMILLELHSKNSFNWLHFNLILFKRNILGFKFAVKWKSFLYLQKNKTFAQAIYVLCYKKSRRKMIFSYSKIKHSVWSEKGKIKAISHCKGLYKSKLALKIPTKDFCPDLRVRFFFVIISFTCKIFANSSFVKMII